MRFLFIMLILVICTNCGTTDTPNITDPEKQYPVETFVDKDLQRFVDEFLRDCTARRTDCIESVNKIKSIRVVDIPDVDKSDDEVVVGLCYDRPFFSKIEISTAIMNQSDLYIRTLVYHEIGHCAYGLDHDKQPDTIMSSVMPSMVVIIRDWKLMLADLFSSIYEKHGD